MAMQRDNVSLQVLKKYFMSECKGMSEIFYNSRREILYLQAAM